MIEIDVGQISLNIIIWNRAHCTQSLIVLLYYPSHSCRVRSTIWGSYMCRSGCWKVSIQKIFNEDMCCCMVRCWRRRLTNPADFSSRSLHLIPAFRSLIVAHFCYNYPNARSIGIISCTHMANSSFSLKVRFLLHPNWCMDAFLQPMYE